MKSDKKLGIWMDYSTAHLMEFINGHIEESVIDSAFTHDEKVFSLSKSEHLMHNKEQQQQGEFYKMLGDKMSGYVYLFFIQIYISVN
jgi:hypothetical protein